MVLLISQMNSSFVILRVRDNNYHQREFLIRNSSERSRPGAVCRLSSTVGHRIPCNRQMKVEGSAVDLDLHHPWPLEWDDIRMSCWLFLHRNAVENTPGQVKHKHYRRVTMATEASLGSSGWRLLGQSFQSKKHLRCLIKCKFQINTINM